MTVLEKIRALRIRRKSDAITTYAELVRAAADDKKLDLETFDVIRERAGKSDADFQAAVAKLLADRERVEKLKTLPALRSQSVDVQRQIETAIARFLNFKKDHLAELDRLRLREHTLAWEISAAMTAESDLMASCNDPTIIQRELALSEQVAVLEAERAKIESELKGQNELSAGHIHRVKLRDVAKLKSRRDPAGRRDYAEKYAELESFEREAIEPRNARLAVIAKHRDAIEQERARLNQRKLNS